MTPDDNERRGGMDEVAHAIGKLQGTIIGLKDEFKTFKDDYRVNQDAQWAKLEKISDALVAQKVKIAVIAGTVTAFFTGVYHFVIKGGH